DMDALEAALTTETRLVSIGHVQGETGAIQDISQIGQLIKAKVPAALFHVDAVQGLCKADFPWNKGHVDMASFSGHKIHAFGGVGALLRRDHVKLSPITFGGGQQGGIRSGSLDAAGMLSFLLASAELLKTPAFRTQAAEMKTVLCEGVATLKDRKGKPVEHTIISPAHASP
ncbi:MAG: aminotransferase class V-fold PLP-dependent enzyme, partial [Planctomycetes bacterium]|nr:aminotransferase class V-fold PLP-dependent enzyme [Planctomycetota bacterium]